MAWHEPSSSTHWIGSYASPTSSIARLSDASDRSSVALASVREPSASPGEGRTGKDPLTSSPDVAVSRARCDDRQSTSAEKTPPVLRPRQSRRSSVFSLHAVAPSSEALSSHCSTGMPRMSACRPVFESEKSGRSSACGAGVSPSVSPCRAGTDGWLHRSIDAVCDLMKLFPAGTGCGPSLRSGEPYGQAAAHEWPSTSTSTAGSRYSPSSAANSRSCRWPYETKRVGASWIE